MLFVLNVWNIALTTSVLLAKSKHMLAFWKRKRQEKEFRQLVCLLVETKKLRRRDFCFICSSFKTRRVRLDNMLYDIVGMSGDEVLLHLQCDYRDIEG